jgi:hypothetical protein
MAMIPTAIAKNAKPLRDIPPSQPSVAPICNPVERRSAIEAPRRSLNRLTSIDSNPNASAISQRSPDY